MKKSESREFGFFSDSPTPEFLPGYYIAKDGILWENFSLESGTIMCKKTTICKKNYNLKWK